jgi:hypothetical protein
VTHIAWQHDEERLSRQLSDWENLAGNLTRLQIPDLPGG